MNGHQYQDVLRQMKQAAANGREMGIPAHQIRGAMPTLIRNIASSTSLKITPSESESIVDAAIADAFGFAAFLDTMDRFVAQLLRDAPGLAAPEAQEEAEKRIVHAALSVVGKFELGPLSDDDAKEAILKAWRKAVAAVLAKSEPDDDEIETAMKYLEKKGLSAHSGNFDAEMKSLGFTPPPPQHYNEKCALPLGQMSELERQLDMNRSAFESGVAALIARRAVEGDPWVNNRECAA